MQHICRVLYIFRKLLSRAFFNEDGNLPYGRARRERFASQIVCLNWQTAGDCPLCCCSSALKPVHSR